MKYEICAKVKNLVPYQPALGEYPIRLDANEGFFDLQSPLYWEEEALPLRDQALSKIRDGLSRVPLNRYPDPTCDALREAFSKRYGTKPSFVTAGNGSDELISLLCGSLMEKGARLVTVSPDFSMYRFYGDIYELENIVWQKPSDLCLDPQALGDFVAEKKGDMLLFSNPCNPTSLVLEKEKVEALVASLPQPLVVVDEAYMEFSSPQSVLDLVEKYDNLVVLKTCSKALGLAGIRLGFAVANETLTRALWAVKSPYNVNSLTQSVGLAVLESPALCRYCTEKIRQSCKDLEQELQSLFAGKKNIRQIFPSQTNFVFLQGPAAQSIFKGLMDRGIMVRNMEGAIRITAGSPEENRLLLKALTEIVR